MKCSLTDLLHESLRYSCVWFSVLVTNEPDTMSRATTLWVLLGIVVLAILALMAFGANRTAVEDMDNNPPGTMTATDNSAMERGAVRTQAAIELSALKARAQAGETYDALAADFADIRARLAASYENTESAAAEEWARLAADFDALEADARAGTSTFLDSLSSLLSRFSADVRVETTNE